MMFKVVSQSFKSFGLFPLLLASYFSLFSLPAIAADSEKKNVSLELALLVDVSGSIDYDEFEIQRKGYADAFKSAPVLERIQQAGEIAVTLIYWSSYYEQQIAIPFTAVNLSNVHAFADEIEKTERPFYGGTEIGPAINFAVPLFGQGFTSLKQVIDVSGDGDSYSYSTAEARDNALAAGIDAINGLPIEPVGSTYLFEFYRDYVIGGENPFIVSAPSFEDFRDAATEKIYREIEIIEQCPDDPLKLLPGVCGCGVPETDLDDDKDGVVNCIDSCPSDPSKTEVGICGCGYADVDTNNNQQVDCLEPNFCGEQASITLKEGITISSAELAALGLQSAKELRKLLKPIANQYGDGNTVPLAKFVGLSEANIRKTEAAIKELVVQLPQIVKSCPLSYICASIDNTANKQAMRKSIFDLFRYAKRATTRVFFVKHVYLSGPPNISEEEYYLLLRKQVGMRRKAIKETTAKLRTKVEEVPDITNYCQ